MIDAVIADRAAVAAFLGVLAVAAGWDVTRYRIPNGATVAVLAIWPAHAAITLAPSAWLESVAVAAAVFAVGLLLFSRRIVGGGDVKLITATALWAGPPAIATLVTVTALVGGLLAVLIASPFRYGLAMALDKAGRIQARDAILGRAVPYGVAIAAGGWAVGLGLIVGGS